MVNKKITIQKQYNQFLKKIIFLKRQYKILINDNSSFSWCNNYEIQKIKISLLKLILFIENNKQYIINKEELIKECYKPSRINYILSIDPDYEF